MTAWTLAAMAELRESICRDLVNKKVFAFHTRVRQPEELYIRTLYALFVASKEEIPHILSGATPNGRAVFVPTDARPGVEVWIIFPEKYFSGNRVS